MQLDLILIAPKSKMFKSAIRRLSYGSFFVVVLFDFVVSNWSFDSKNLHRFVKHQRMGKPLTDDDEKSIATPRGPMARLVRALSGRNASAEAETPPSEKEAPAEDGPTTTSKDSVENAPTVENVIEEEVDNKEAELSLTKDIPKDASDDNDGAAEPSLCAGCTGCVIL